MATLPAIESRQTIGGIANSAAAWSSPVFSFFLGNREQFGNGVRHFPAVSPMGRPGINREWRDDFTVPLLRGNEL